MDDKPLYPYRGCSFRAIAVGLALAAFMAVAIPYGDMIIKGSQMGVWNTSPGAIFLFVVLVGLVNVALRLTHRGLALDKSELAVVYILLLIANTLPARGFAAYVMPIATGAQYYATPENDWAERLLPFLPNWATDVLILLISACANGLKLAEQIGRHKRRLFWAIMGTVLITLAIAMWIRLETAYAHGAINLNQFYAANSAWYPYRYMDIVVSAPLGPHIDGWIQVGVGAGIMAILELLHYKFLWWPFHPLGFPISSAFGSMWFSVFVAFILKSIMLKYDGPNLYRRAVPFFLGLIVGEIVPAGCWLIIDLYTGMHGNVIGTFLN